MKRWVARVGNGLWIFVEALGAAVAAGIRWLLYRRPRVRHFVQHLFEMVVAMVAGMMLLGMAWSGLWPALSDLPAVDAIVMALNMTIGMGLWMWIRGHAWRMIAEMGGAMVGPFVVLLVPYYLEQLSGDELMELGHMAMMVAMIAVMVLRIRHYTLPQGWRSFRRRPVERTELTATALTPTELTTTELTTTERAERTDSRPISVA